MGSPVSVARQRVTSMSLINVTEEEAALRRQRVLELLGRLPEAKAEATGEQWSLEVRGRRFAWYLENHHNDRRLALHCKAERGTNRDRVEADPVRLHMPKYVGHHGWLGVWIDLPDVDWTLVAGLLEEAYRMTAPKSLVGQLAAQGSATVAAAPASETPPEDQPPAPRQPPKASRRKRRSA